MTTTRAIEATANDREALDAMLDTDPDFAAEGLAFGEVVGEGHWDLWADLFVAFYGVAPRLNRVIEMDPRYLAHRDVMELVMAVDEMTTYRRWTVGDPMAAASGVIALRPTVERIVDRLRIAERRRAELAKLGAEAVADETFDAAAFDSLVAKREELEAVQAEVGTLLVRSALRSTMDDVAAMAATARAWSADPGHLLAMSPRRRLELAKRMLNERFTMMFDFIGPLEAMMNAARQQRRVDVPGEIDGMTTGRDLTRLPAAVLARFAVPALVPTVAADWVTGTLPQHRWSGVEDVGRGALAMLCDGSSSLAGPPEMLSKAVALVFLHLARQQDRGFRCTHFGSPPGRDWATGKDRPAELATFDFTPPYPLERVVEMAEHFWCGGTSYVDPLDLELGRLVEEFETTGRVGADLVMATDGKCEVPEDWQVDFLATMERIGATMWGILIVPEGEEPYWEPLRSLCQGRVALVTDLMVAGPAQDLGALFGGVEDGYAESHNCR